MRLPDEKKRQHICAVAARLFARGQYHRVRLEDVAAAARVGKGTLYVYFRSKEDLYFSLVHEGFAGLVDRLKQQLSDAPGGSAAKLRRVVEGLVDFAYQHPHVFELVRRGGVPKSSGRWEEKRQELSDLVERIIRAGIRRGEFADRHPELTAMLIPGMVRSAMLYGPKGISKNVLTGHMMRLLQQGLSKEQRA